MTKKTFIEKQEALDTKIMEYVKGCIDTLFPRIHSRRSFDEPEKQWDVALDKQSEAMGIWVNVADNAHGSPTYTRPKIHQGKLCTRLQLNCRDEPQDYWDTPDTWHHIVTLDVSSKEIIDSYFDALHTEIDTAIQEKMNHDNP